jgi:hypothetical protein
VTIGPVDGPIVSVIPGLIDALIARAADALPDRVVADGFHTGADAADFLEVGVEDPDLTGFTTSADSAQSWAHATGRGRDEEGDLACAAVSWSTDGDPRAARQAAFETVAAVSAIIHADPTIGGVPGLLWTVFGARLEYHHGQTDDGAVAQVLFQIHYRARL